LQEFKYKLGMNGGASILIIGETYYLCSSSGLQHFSISYIVKSPDKIL